MLMFDSRNDFDLYLENAMPEHILEKYNVNTLISPSVEDLFLMQERAKCATIQEVISSTHVWEKGIIKEPDGFIRDIFQCRDCGYRASIYNHVTHLSIIEKIRDNLPTYDVHNEYIMYECGEVRKFDLEETAYEDCGFVICDDCGLNEQICTTFYAEEAELGSIGSER